MRALKTIMKKVPQKPCRAMSVYVSARNPRHVSVASIFTVLKLAILGTRGSLPRFKRYSGFIYIRQHKGKKGCNTALSPVFILRIIYIYIYDEYVHEYLCIHLADRYWVSHLQGHQNLISRHNDILHITL